VPWETWGRTRIGYGTVEGHGRQDRFKAFLSDIKQRRAFAEQDHEEVRSSSDALAAEKRAGIEAQGEDIVLKDRLAAADQRAHDQDEMIAQLLRDKKALTAEKEQLKMTLWRIGVVLEHPQRPPREDATPTTALAEADESSTQAPAIEEAETWSEYRKRADREEDEMMDAILAD
jgi:hypothetical protein